MTSGLSNFKDYAEFISHIVTSLSLVGILLTYVMSMKQINFSTMQKCITDFRNIIKENDGKEKTLHYIDLVNEELFYIENGYLSLDVAIEWVDGMIDFLPFLIKDKNVEPSLKFKLFDTHENITHYLKDYPRVRRAISLKRDIEFEKVRNFINYKEDKSELKNERDELIFQIITNLKLGWWDRLRLKGKIANR